MCYNGFVKSALFFPGRRNLGEGGRLPAVRGCLATYARPPRSPSNSFTFRVLAHIALRQTRNAHKSSLPCFQRVRISLIPQGLAFLCFHTLAHSFALSKNSTRFFSTASALFTKKHGGGVCLLYFLCLLQTATPFPQRWGQLRKGRTVFRREDRQPSYGCQECRPFYGRQEYCRAKTQFSGGGGGAATGGKVVRNFPRWPCSMV